MELFIKKQRNEKTIYCLNEQHELYESMQDLIRDGMHFECLPCDEVFELASSIYDSMLESVDYDDFMNTESIYPVYTCDIARLYTNMWHILDAGWEDFNECCNRGEYERPIDHMTSVINGYVYYAINAMASWGIENDLLKES